MQLERRCDQYESSRETEAADDNEQKPTKTERDEQTVQEEVCGGERRNTPPKTRLLREAFAELTP